MNVFWYAIVKIARNNDNNKKERGENKQNNHKWMKTLLIPMIFRHWQIMTASECVVHCMQCDCQHTLRDGEDHKWNQFLTSSIDWVLSPQHQNTPLSHLNRRVLASFSFEINWTDFLSHLDGHAHSLIHSLVHNAHTYRSKFAKIAARWLLSFRSYINVRQIRLDSIPRFFFQFNLDFTI